MYVILLKQKFIRIQNFTKSSLNQIAKDFHLMNQKLKLKHTLITFKLCPFSMRVTALMCHKNIKFEIKFIEMHNKPDWFMKLSPLGKVPILIVGEDVVLFESDAIMEYLDEITPPMLMSSDPIQKALDRGKFEYASEMIRNLSLLLFCQDEDKFFKQKELLKKNFQQMEDWLQGGNFVNGNEISLVDFSFIPIFVNLCIFKQVLANDFLKQYPKFASYGERLSSLPSVKAGKVPDFEFLVLEGIRNQKSFFFRSNPCFFSGKQENKCCWFSKK